MPIQLAVQLYTLRDFCKTPADIATTLKKVAAMGYKAVQASALGQIEPAALKKLLNDNGLVCCATHKSLDDMLNKTQALIDEQATLDSQFTAIGGFFPKPDEFTKENWQSFIADLNAAAAKCSASGLRLGYHNHSHEFASFAPTGGQTPWSMLLDQLHADVFIEIDTYWVQHGGGDPATWIAKLPGRVPCVHLKDMGMTPAREHQMRSVGAGNMNWDRILDACRQTNVRWYIVEQDHCNGLDPFECLKASRDFLLSKGLE